MSQHPSKVAASFLLLGEYFAAENDAFLEQLRALSEPKQLAAFVERWKSDPRPWARGKMLDYVALPFTTPGHNVVVKRLFKHAEKQRDTALMAAFVHAFDCMVRRHRKMRWRWDPSVRQGTQEEVLVTPRDQLMPAKNIVTRNPRTGEQISVPLNTRRSGILFSHRTRYYLRRRAWRYFRLLGYRNLSEYPAAIAPALARYTDEDLAKGENLLDSWCLLNICCRKSAAIAFTPSHVRLNEGRSLNELAPAPKLASAWMSSAGADALWNLLSTAQSRFVRLWTIQLLKQHHKSFLSQLTPTKLLPLFDTFDADVQQFASQLLQELPGLATLPVDTWLQLLQTKDPGALAVICGLMVRHVTADRLTLAQLISLTIAAPAPVANLGLIFLRTRTFSKAEFTTLSDLAQSRSEATASAITHFALSLLGASDNYDVALVSRFFDALLAPTRDAAWNWLTPDSAGYKDPALWSRLFESPYEDIRLRLVAALQTHKSLAESVDAVTPIWTAVLLGIHRGGRQKIIALHQISRALVEHSARAESLLPILAIAIRSVRPAEVRVGLAAVVHAVEANPALIEPASRLLPELRFVSAGAAA